MKARAHIESIVRYGIIALGVYLALACVLIYTQFNRLTAAERWVEHSQEVRYALQDVLSLVLDAESSQRAYTLVGTEVYLMDHFGAVTRLRTALADVQDLTGDNPLQNTRARELAELVETKISQMRANINFVRDIDRETAIENFRTGALRTVSSEIRAAIDVMLAEENRLFAERSVVMDRTAYVTVGIFIALLFLFGVVAVAYFLLSERNLAARNRMLTELSEAKAKSERADAFKSDLLNYIGRALYRPLTQITSQTDLMLYRATNTLGEKDQKMVSDIRSTARFLLSLASNFLHIGRLQAGKPLHLIEDDVDIVDMSREAIAIMADSAAKHGVTISYTSSFARALMRCDKMKVRQIILNLLDNAIKNTPAGGTVNVGISQSEKQDVVVAVRDTGGGIPAERLQQVMIPFAQIDNMFEREEKGLGLGLPMALGFAQAHGGSLQIGSGPKGTTATLTLPAHRTIRVFAAGNAA